MAAIILLLVAASIIAVILGRAFSVLPSDLGSDLEVLVSFYILAFVFAWTFGNIGRGLMLLHRRYANFLTNSLTPGAEDTTKLFGIYLTVGILVDLVFFSFAFLLPSQFWLALLSLPFAPLEPVWSALTNFVVARIGEIISPLTFVGSAPIGPVITFLIREAKRERSIALSHIVLVIPYVTYLSAIIWTVSLSEAQSIPPVSGLPDLVGPQYWFFLLRYLVLILPSTAFSALAVALLEGK